MSAVVGVFGSPAPVAEAAKKLRQRGFEELEIYSPVPSHELDDAVDERPSRVRVFTLIGGLVGAISGYAMTIWMANNWPIMIGGKPLSSIPPYTIISFELAILFGGVLTVLGLFGVGRLPRVKSDRAYSKRFSSEEFGLVVRCRSRDVVEVEDLLREQGAKEVTLVEA
jgi:molybdopterin-containing oxidoreductase family membrane subunit